MGHPVFEKKNIYLLCKGRPEEKEKEENIRRSKLLLCRGEENRKTKMRTIFGKEKYTIPEEEKNGEEKGGKYLEKENISCGEEEKRRGKIFGEGKLLRTGWDRTDEHLRH